MFDENTTRQIKEDLSQLADDVSRLRREVGDKSAHKLGHLRDDAREKLNEARHHAADKAKRVDKYVHENPWAATGAAIALGAVLGALLTKKSNNHR